MHLQHIIKFQTMNTQEEKTVVGVVIIHKKSVYKNMLFDNAQQAKKWLRLQQPKRRWKMIQNESVFVCCLYGSKFEFVELVKPA